MEESILWNMLVMTKVIVVCGCVFGSIGTSRSEVTWALWALESRSANSTIRLRGRVGHMKQITFASQPGESWIQVTPFSQLSSFGRFTDCRFVEIRKGHAYSLLRVEEAVAGFYVLCEYSANLLFRRTNPPDSISLKSWMTSDCILSYICLIKQC